MYRSVYAEIEDTSSSRIRGYQADLIAGLPWTIHNALPFAIRVMYQPPGGKAAVLTKVRAHGRKAVRADAAGRPLVPGGVLAAAAAAGPDQRAAVAGPYVLDPQYKSLSLGAASYDDGGHGQNFYNLHADVHGVHIVNHFPFPLELVFEGNVVAVVGAADGRGYHSGSQAQVYFDNAREGLRLGDVLTVRTMKHPTGRAVTLYSVVLDDIHTHTIHLGVVAPMPR